MPARHAVLLVFLGFVFLHSSWTEASDAEPVQDVAKLISVGKGAIPVKHDPPRYPSKALREGTEGWVIVNFKIKQDGTTDDIAVINASIDNYFESTAIRTVRDWTYEPATLNGKPVTQANRKARLTFSIVGSGAGVSKNFLQKYKKASNAILEGDLEAARVQIEELDADKKRRLAEVFNLDVLKVAYWQQIGNNKLALRHVEQALIIADQVASKGMHIKLLRQGIVANAISTNYGATLKHYETLLEVDTELASDDSVHDIANRVRQALNGDTIIETAGEVALCSHCQSGQSLWRHELNRNRFSVVQVDGELTGLEIACGFHTVSLAYDPDLVWKVNKDWGECAVRVFGEEGSNLRLLEYQNDS